MYNNFTYPPHSEIMKAYLSYEASCDHSYDFICIECGIYPTVILTDVNKKCCFKLNSTVMSVFYTHIIIIKVLKIINENE